MFFLCQKKIISNSSRMTNIEEKWLILKDSYFLNQWIKNKTFFFDYWMWRCSPNHIWKVLIWFMISLWKMQFHYFLLYSKKIHFLTFWIIQSTSNLLKDKEFTIYIGLDESCECYCCCDICWWDYSFTE